MCLMKNVIIIGAGAAGMMCSIKLAREGHKVSIIEKNDKPGKKLFITGKGRCNLTNDSDVETLMKNTVVNPKFMYSAYYGFTPDDTKNFFENLGLRIKTERGNRVFPLSDHSSDVIKVLSDEMKRLGVEILYETEVKELVLEDRVIPEGEKSKADRKAIGVKVSGKNKGMIDADVVVVATGGKSYQTTGSTGDGYRFASEAGLDVVEPKPSLVALRCSDLLCKDLMGLTLKNVSVKFTAIVKNKTKVVYEDFGELLFTHFGVSGPTVLSASSYLHKYMDSGVSLSIDLKPALSVEELDKRVLRDFESSLNKQLRNALDDLLPKSMIGHIIEKSGIDPFKKVNEITKEERESLVSTLKNLKLEITGYRGFEEAIITSGGVSVKEVNPGTMEAKKVKDLYFIGEVLDVDALTGGFNLQIAWSTANAVEI